MAITGVNNKYTYYNTFALPIASLSSSSVTSASTFGSLLYFSASSGSSGTGSGFSFTGFSAVSSSGRSLFSDSTVFFSRSSYSIDYKSIRLNNNNTNNNVRGFIHNAEMWSPFITLSPQNNSRCDHINFLQYILPVAWCLKIINFVLITFNNF